MKIGDLVRVRFRDCSRIGTIVTDFRHGINRSFCEILLADGVITADLRTLELVNESR